MMPCQNHPGRAGSVVLDWDDDDDQEAGVACVCVACIVPELARLAETLAGEPAIHIRLAGPNPHPADPGDDTVICAGCGFPVGSLDDIAVTDAPGDPTGLTVWHVNCPMPAGLTMTPDGPVWAGHER